MAEEKNEPIGHETRDVRVRLVVWFAVGLVGAGLIVHLLLAGLYRWLETQNPSPFSPSRIVVAPPGNVAPAPRLQTNPQADLAGFAAAEEKRLHSYGWVDQDAGIVHIPIERALELIAERGLPTRGPGTNNSSGLTPEQLQQQKAAATAVPAP